MGNQAELNEEIIKKKAKCIENPESNLFPIDFPHNNELKEIFNHLNVLNFEVKPNYDLIR